MAMARTSNHGVAVLLLIGSLTGVGVGKEEALGTDAPDRPRPTQGVSQAESERNKFAVLKYVLPALNSAGKAGRIYYAGACQPADNVPIPFPKTNLQPPSNTSTGLAAIREIFRNDNTVEVTEQARGLLKKIRIGNVADAILKTTISVLRLDQGAQYNDQLAAIAIEATRM